MADFLLAGTNDNFMFVLCCGIVILVTFLVFNISRNMLRPEDTVRQRPEARGDASQDVCPICLGTHVLAVETNCGHKFCGSCMKSYLSGRSWDFTVFSTRVTCPICRQAINILLFCFLPEETHSVELETERVAVERVVSEYNIRFGRGPLTVSNYIRDCPVLIRHMVNDFFTFGGLLWMFRLRVILCCMVALAYFFNPMDFVPEAVFGMFGFLDDIIVFILCVIYFSIIYRRVVINRGINNT